jgi:hypothetical protein
VSRTAANFRQSDLVKVIKAARANGLDVMRMEMRDRTVFVHFSGDESVAVVNELDAWRATRSARSA